MAEAAHGYSHQEDKVFCQNGEVTVVPTTKHYPPNTTAAMFWLQNRKPQEWRNVQYREMSGKVTVESTQQVPELNLSDFTTEELLVIKRAGIKYIAQATDDAPSE